MSPATGTTSSATRAGSTSAPPTRSSAWPRPSARRASGCDGAGQASRSDTPTSLEACPALSPGARVMAATADALRQRLAGAPTVGVVGLGYVGLPLAVAFAESGATVVGVDLDAQRVAAVRAGRSFIEDVPAATLARVVGAGRLGASDDVAALEDADAIVICVPTPLGKSKEPHISFIVSAADAVARIIPPRQPPVLESTTYPGTTQEILLPRFEARGLKAGEDFFLAFSPERIDPGNRRFTLRDIPKVVGGLTPACRELATALYARIAREIVPVSRPEPAEMVKLFANTFRSVDIALVNEFAIMSRRLGT